MELNHSDKIELFQVWESIVFSTLKKWGVNTEKVGRFDSYPKKHVTKNGIYGEGSYQVPTHSPLRIWTFLLEENTYSLREHLACHMQLMQCLDCAETTGHRTECLEEPPNANALF